MNTSMPEKCSSYFQPIVSYREYWSRTLVRVIAIVASIYGVLISWDGWMAFTYFTKLSNVMICVALFGSLIMDTLSAVRGLGRDAKDLPSMLQDDNEPLPANTMRGWYDTKTNAWYIFKFMMTISITVTFTLYLCFLAPTDQDGFVLAYLRQGAGSLCVHFIAPLLAIIDFLLFDYRFRSSRIHLYCSTLPPLAYVCYIVLLSQLGGVRWGKHHMHAPYNFLNYGAPAGWFGFQPSTLNAATLGIGVAYLLVIFTLIFLGIGSIFLLLKNRRARLVA